MSRKSTTLNRGPEESGLLRALFGPSWHTIMLISAGVFCVVMMALAIVNERGFLAMWRMQHEISLLAHDVQATEQENRALWHDVKRLRDDMGYLEKLAREELGLVRPGEWVIEFVE